MILLKSVLIIAIVAVGGVAIFVDKAHTGLQPIDVITVADIENIEEETTSV